MTKEFSNKEFSNIDGLWLLTLGDLLDCHVTSSEKGLVREIIGFSATLENTNATFLQNERRKLSAWYAAAETLWYLSGTNKTEMIKVYAPQYERFEDKNRPGIAYGAYGHRITEQFAYIHDLLGNRSSTRQAIINIWNDNDLEKAVYDTSNDMPCTLSWQFLLRGNKLHMICTMRSNDIWLGLPYDIFANTTIQKLLANDLDVLPGKYVHNVGSMHLYENNFVAAREALGYNSTKTHDYEPNEFDTIGDAISAVAYEEYLRRGTRCGIQSRTLGPILEDLKTCVASFWDKENKNYLNYITSPALKQGLMYDYNRSTKKC